ncbi:MAG: hypothetical protein AB1716_07105 [Planctomycetota bacterium]
MSMRVIVRGAVPAAVLLCLALPAPGQPREDAPRIGLARTFNIEAMLDAHAKFLARRYNLTAEQEAYTQAYLHQKANEFLAQHGEDFYDLVDKLIEVRTGAEVSQQELMQWGQRAMPLYNEAKQLIVDGNNEWRQILNEEQRKTHDQDLREMHQSFATTEGQLQRMVVGQLTVDELRNGARRVVPQMNAAGPIAAANRPAHQSSTLSPPTGRPPKPGAAAVQNPSPPAPAPTSPPPARPGGAAPVQPLGGRTGKMGPATAISAGDFESQWETYVREFIQKHDLTEPQQQKARVILQDCQQTARRQMQRSKPEIERLDKRTQALNQSDDKDKLKQLQEIQQAKAKLLAPIDEIFEKRLKPRLDRLLSPKQRAAAADKNRPGQPAAAGRPAQPPVQPQPVPPPTPPQEMPPPPMPHEHPMPMPPPDVPPPDMPSPDAPHD